MDNSSRAGSCLFGAVLVLMVGSCGGGGSSPTTPTTTLPPSTPCTQSVVIQDAGAVPPLTLVYDDFSLPDSGRLDITVDWTNASSPIGVYLVPVNTCTLAEFNARTCTFLVRSEPPGTKPRKISTPNFSAGNYRWILANGSQADESISLLIVLSKGSCAALTTTSMSASAHHDESLPIKQALHR